MRWCVNPTRRADFLLPSCATSGERPSMTFLPLRRIALLLSLVVCSAVAQDPPLEPGFVSLFNGKDLTGWGYTPQENFDGKTEASDGRYTARDGVLVVNPRKEGSPKLRQLWTTKEFPKDFE